MGRPRRKFTLYWSNLSMYEGCPQSFLWGRGWGTIDVGGGPGRRKPRPLEDSRQHAVMGIVLADFWEALYNDEEWRRPEGLMGRLLARAQKCFDQELLTNHVDWRISQPRDELWDCISSGIQGYLRTMKAQKLLGPYAKSEVDLATYVDQHTPVGGRADLIFRRSDTGVTILDGKNSRRYKDRKTKKWMTHTDPDQLRWYAMCFYLLHGVMPDRLGFVYFRYPFGAPKLDVDGEEVPAVDENNMPTGDVEREEGVEWVPFTLDDLKGIAVRAKDALRGMNAENFPARPEPPKGRFCSYETVCPERQAQKQKNRRNRKKSESFFDGITTPVTFGMGPKGSILIPGE